MVWKKSSANAIVDNVAPFFTRDNKPIWGCYFPHARWYFKRTFPIYSYLHVYMFYIDFHFANLYNWYLNTLLDHVTVAACLPPKRIFNGAYAPVEGSGIHHFGTDVSYTCTVGYYISHGNASLTCNTDGTWMGIVPTCSRKQFDVIITITFC